MGEMSELMADTTIESLRRHEPFKRMDSASLHFLASRISLAYYARGRQITSPEHGAAKTLFIIQKGQVRGQRSQTAPFGIEQMVVRNVGECFPLSSVYSNRQTNYSYIAEEDTFCYEADARTVSELADRSQVFKDFCNDRIGTMLKQAFAHMQTFYASQTNVQQPMNSFLGDLIRKKPVTAIMSDSLISALSAMYDAKASCVVVVDGDFTPVGIFTERDLMRSVVSGPFDTSTPIRHFMKPNPRTLPTTATAYEAAALMARTGFRHVPVVEEQKLAGVVSEHDLFALQSMTMHDIGHSVDLAKSVEELSKVARDINRLAGHMIAQGVGAEHLTQLIATLNDKISRKVIEIEVERFDLQGIRFCWLSLGSEGRLEQTLTTDQDNGIVFFDGDSSPESKRTRLLPFAQAVNNSLDLCGFTLCKGNIMAGNPEWCLSLQEWMAKFDSWIRSPMPTALLNAAIFFDFRHLWGDETLANKLRTWLSSQVKGKQNFLRAMAENALQSRPPLGLISGFSSSVKGGGPKTIDLKVEGSRIFVDVARIYALSMGFEETNTLIRLRLAAERFQIQEAEIDAITEAFNFILLMRLRYQGEDPHSDQVNRIDPEKLNDLDRRILKEAFRQARKIQNRLSVDYQL